MTSMNLFDNYSTFHVFCVLRVSQYLNQYLASQAEHWNTKIKPLEMSNKIFMISNFYNTL